MRKLSLLLFLALCSSVSLAQDSQVGDDVKKVKEDKEESISLLDIAAKQQEELKAAREEDQEPQDLKIVLEDEGNFDAEYLYDDDDGQEEGSQKQKKKSEPYRYRGYGSYRGRYNGYRGGHSGYSGHRGYSGYSGHAGYGGYGGHDLVPVGNVRTRVTVQKRILRPRVRVPAVHHTGGLPGDFEGSYVAVSGRPGERTVHAVNGRGSVAIQPGLPPVVGGPIHRGGGGIGGGVDYLYDDGFIGLGGNSLGGEILPRCSYFNTDFRGNDVGDGRGITVRSAYGCKQACIDTNRCEYWTYRRGWARNCYLKRDNDGRPDGLNRRLGFVSGTASNNCDCLSNSRGRICPTRTRGDAFIPWRRRGGSGDRGGIGARFDYDYADDYDVYDDIDDGDREVATRTRTRTRNRGDDDDDDDDGNNGGRRSNRNRGNNNDDDDGDNGGGRRTRTRSRSRNDNLEDL